MFPWKLSLMAIWANKVNFVVLLSSKWWQHEGSGEEYQYLCARHIWRPPYLSLTLSPLCLARVAPPPLLIGHPLRALPVNRNQEIISWVCRDRPELLFCTSAGSGASAESEAGPFAGFRSVCLSRSSCLNRSSCLYRTFNTVLEYIFCKKNRFWTKFGQNIVCPQRKGAKSGPICFCFTNSFCSSRSFCASANNRILGFFLLLLLQKLLPDNSAGATAEACSDRSLWVWHYDFSLSEERKSMDHNRRKNIQGSTDRRAPGSVNAAGKLRQKW